jgi:hypothetical protein
MDLIKQYNKPILMLCQTTNVRSETFLSLLSPSEWYSAGRALTTHDNIQV